MAHIVPARPPGYAVYAAFYGVLLCFRVFPTTCNLCEKEGPFGPQGATKWADYTCFPVYFEGHNAFYPCFYGILGQAPDVPGRATCNLHGFLLHFEHSEIDRKSSKNVRSQISKCCKNFLNHVFSTKTKISHAYEPNRHFPEDTSSKKLFP